MIQLPQHHDDLHTSHPECLSRHLHDEQSYPSLHDVRGGDNGVWHTQNPSGEPHGQVSFYLFPRDRTYNPYSIMGRLLIISNLQANIWRHDGLRVGIPAHDHQMGPPQQSIIIERGEHSWLGSKPHQQERPPALPPVRYWGRCDHCCYQYKF